MRPLSHETWPLIAPYDKDIIQRQISLAFRAKDQHTKTIYHIFPGPDYIQLLLRPWNRGIVRMRLSNVQILR